VGSQVGFFADRKDFGDLLAVAQEIGLLVVPRCIERGTRPAAISPSELRGTDAIFGLFVGGTTTKHLVYEELPKPERESMLISRNSPVIEVMKCMTKRGSIANGRIYFNTSKHVAHYEEIRKAYERLARHIRKWDKTARYRFYVGPHTTMEVRTGRLKLDHLGEQLDL
jgi:hypothetical protein